MKSLSTLTPVALVLMLGACSTTSQQAEGAKRPASSAKSSSGPGANPEVAAGALRDALLTLGRVHFALNSRSLLPEAQAALAEAAPRLREHADVHLFIDGHADERGTTEYNIALGDQRSKTVKDYLVRMGVAADRLHVVSFGKERPLAKGHDAAAWAQNRRVEFRLMRGNVQLVLQEGTPVDDQGRPIAFAPAARPNRVKT